MPTVIGELKFDLSSTQKIQAHRSYLIRSLFTFKNIGSFAIAATLILAQSLVLTQTALTSWIWVSFLILTLGAGIWIVGWVPHSRFKETPPESHHWKINSEELEIQIQSPSQTQRQVYSWSELSKLIQSKEYTFLAISGKLPLVIPHDSRVGRTPPFLKDLLTGPTRPHASKK